MKRKKKNMYKKSVNAGSKFRGHRFLVKGIAGILIILGLMGGGYVFWRHHTGKIADGLYQLQTAKYITVRPRPGWTVNLVMKEQS